MSGTVRDPEPPPPLDAESALFLDFDGTLAQLAEDPDAAALPPEGRRILARLSIRLEGAVAIPSGRDARDLAIRAPRGLWRIGGHGLEPCEPGRSPGPPASGPPQALCGALERLAAAHGRARLERKGPILALHYRAAPEAGPILAAAVESILAGFPGYKLQAGKMVLEAKPVGADKGAALASAMARPPFRGRVPVMVGDDATDEDAFVAAQAMGGYGVKVGDGDTIAAHRLPSTDAVWRWLEEAAA